MSVNTSSWPETAFHHCCACAPCVVLLFTAPRGTQPHSSSGYHPLCFIVFVVMLITCPLRLLEVQRSQNVVLPTSDQQPVIEFLLVKGMMNLFQKVWTFQFAICSEWCLCKQLLECQKTLFCLLGPVVHVTSNVVAGTFCAVRSRCFNWCDSLPHVFRK